MTRPQAPRSVLLTTGAWLVCMLLASCGDDSPKRSSTTSQGAGQKAAVEIGSPADSTRVRARVTSSGAWSAALKVRGRAAAGATVFFRAGCRPQPCLQRTRADGRGRFSATLKVKTQPSAAFVTVDAGPAEVFGDGSDVITVELYDPAHASAAPSKPRATRARRPARRALPREVLVIGDSLAVGFAPALKEELEGWRVRVDARVGRPLREGMRIAARQGKKAPAILAFSLFTNNSPRETEDLETAVRATATRAGSCAVWATIVRPPYRGRSYAATNRMLRGLADQQLGLGLRIVDWADAVDEDRSLLARDRIHATPAGYATLARMYAEAIRSCAGESR